MKLEESSIDNILENLLKRSPNQYDTYQDTVAEILNDVKENGDKALFAYTEKFDKAVITKDTIKVTEEEIKEAYDQVDDSLIEVMKKSLANIRDFHEKQLRNSWFETREDGVILGQRVTALESVGVYVPGGKAVYPSSVLMNIVPAKIAGVAHVVMCTPCNKEGKVNPAVLVAAKEAGADEVYKVGGAQAIGAMAYSTESIPKVEKIVGPGNIFVTAAKKLVYGEVDIEFPAGPSEVLILADKTANAEYIATDILSQAEHDPKASCFFVTDDENLAEDVLEFVDKKTEDAPRAEIIKEALSNSGKIILTKNFEDAVYVTNEYAPEHLVIMTKDDESTLSQINNAGSIFLGKYSPVACGDYGSGTNHVLPTGGGAKMYSGLSTESFIKKPTVQKITQEGLEKISTTCIPIAEYEGLFAHVDSIKTRLNK